jgi:hypothetical protein
VHPQIIIILRVIEFLEVGVLGDTVGHPLSSSSLISEKNGIFENSVVSIQDLVSTLSNFVVIITDDRAKIS